MKIVSTTCSNFVTSKICLLLAVSRLKLSFWTVLSIYYLTPIPVTRYAAASFREWTECELPVWVSKFKSYLNWSNYHIHSMLWLKKKFVLIDSYVYNWLEISDVILAKVLNFSLLIARIFGIHLMEFMHSYVHPA